MKKFIYSLLAVLGLASVASAQNHVSQSFLNVQSLNVSNLLAITNLTFTPAWTTSPATNRVGLQWTNLSSTRVIVTASSTTDSASTFNTLKDVSLWSDRNGQGYVPFGAYQSNGNTATNANPVGPATLFIRLFGQAAAANSAVTFTFCPVWDDVGTSPNATTDDWAVALTASGTSFVTLATNVPMYRWPGAKGLKLKTIVNGDTDADSRVTVDRLSINGYRP